MNAPYLRIESRQQQTLSPWLQRAVRLLQLSSLDFAQEVRELMLRNPFLDGLDDDAEAQAAEEPSPPDAADDDAAAEAARDDEYDPWSGEGGGAARIESGDETSALELVPAVPTLAEHLHAQLNLLRLPWRELVLARAIVESLDDDGYLRTELAELARLPLLAPPPEADELHLALTRVQSLDPAGVAARSLAECLRLQLPKIDDAAEREAARRLLELDLALLTRRDCRPLAARLRVDPAVLAAAHQRIRRFDPRPGSRFGGVQTQYIVPDVIVRKSGRRWVARLNPRVMPRLRLNEGYAQVFQRHRSGRHDEMASQLQEARWTLQNLQQRFDTILAVARAITERQQQFLDYGPMAMKPLMLREIAEVVGVHESTVCRATHNKYMATPAGVFELKYFFSRGVPTGSGGSASPTAIKGLVREMIEAEDPAAPLSDAEISRQLARQGLPLVRRTVTKYRQAMRIEVAERRRQSL
ncbi:MAG: RNA polymerase factor sigma-54 [Rubrivivax sp.]|nr:RNA polymerase factor sigma-54 [Rubrivivax sp.]